MSSSKEKFGFVSLVGPPNVGKSTLLNNLIGRKISIVSRRPQTTRHRILGVKTQQNSQVVFVDTPGLHVDHKKTLNRVFNKTAVSSLNDVDLIVFMIDFGGWTQALQKIFEPVSKANVPVVLVINKIDKLKDKTALLSVIDNAQKIFDFQEIMPISAISLKDVKRIEQVVNNHLPEGPPGFPENQITDRSDRFLASELVREQMFFNLGQELPYETAVEVTKFEENDRQVLCVEATIWVDRAGQKIIIVGKKGAQLKMIGMNARKQMEFLFEKKVFLNLWVKVRKGWADNQAMLQSLGYSET